MFRYLEQLSGGNDVESEHIQNVLLCTAPARHMYKYYTQFSNYTRRRQAEYNCNDHRKGICRCVAIQLNRSS